LQSLTNEKLREIDGMLAEITSKAELAEVDILLDAVIQQCCNTDDRPKQPQTQLSAARFTTLTSSNGHLIAVMDSLKTVHDQFGQQQYRQQSRLDVARNDARTLHESNRNLNTSLDALSTELVVSQASTEVERRKNVSSESAVLEQAETISELKNEVAGLNDDVAWLRSENSAVKADLSFKAQMIARQKKTIIELSDDKINLEVFKRTQSSGSSSPQGRLGGALKVAVQAKEAHAIEMFVRSATDGAPKLRCISKAMVTRNLSVNWKAPQIMRAIEPGEVVVARAVAKQRLHLEDGHWVSIVSRSGVLLFELLDKKAPSLESGSTEAKLDPEPWPEPEPEAEVADPPADTSIDVDAIIQAGYGDLQQAVSALVRLRGKNDALVAELAAVSEHELSADLKRLQVENGAFQDMLAKNRKTINMLRRIDAMRVIELRERPTRCVTLSAASLDEPEEPRSLNAASDAASDAGSDASAGSGRGRSERITKEQKQRVGQAQDAFKSGHYGAAVRLWVRPCCRFASPFTRVTRAFEQIR
jgi:hypothetical protein